MGMSGGSGTEASGRKRLKSFFKLRGKTSDNKESLKELSHFVKEKAIELMWWQLLRFRNFQLPAKRLRVASAFGSSRTSDSEAGVQWMAWAGSRNHPI